VSDFRVDIGRVTHLVRFWRLFSVFPRETTNQTRKALIISFFDSVFFWSIPIWFGFSVNVSRVSEQLTD